MSAQVIDLEYLNSKFDGTDESAMHLAYDVAHAYSSCRLCGVGKGVGAIINVAGKIVVFGYNGIVDHITPCTKDTCLRLVNHFPHGTNRDICYGDCAEKRAFINAYKKGIIVEKGTIYVTKKPCVSCCKMIINLGINRVVYNEEYSNSEFSNVILKEAGVEVVQLKNFVRSDH